MVKKTDNPLANIVKMKKLYSIFFVALFVSPAFGQTPKVEGLGRFKIKSTKVTVIDSLTDELKAKLVPVKTYLEYLDKRDKGKKVNVFELLPNPAEEVAPPGPDVRYFLLKEYTISGIKVEDMELKFYKDTLMEITAAGSKEVKDAFQAKYGDPVSEMEKKNISCTLQTTGADITLDGYNITNTWKNGDIEAIITDRKDYKYDCTLYYSDDLEIVSTSLFMAYFNYKKAQRENADKKAQEEKAKGLKDF